jgi:hypothetical protein
VLEFAPSSDFIVGHASHPKIADNSSGYMCQAEAAKCAEGDSAGGIVREEDLIGVSESHQFGDMENDVGVTWPWMEHILCTATLVVIELGSELVEFEYGACVGYPSVVFEVRRALCHVPHDHAFEVGAGLFQYPQGAHTLALMWERIVDADRSSRLRLCGRGCTDHLPHLGVHLLA